MSCPVRNSPVRNSEPIARASTARRQQHPLMMGVSNRGERRLIDVDRMRGTDHKARAGTSMRLPASAPGSDVGLCTMSDDVRNRMMLCGIFRGDKVHSDKLGIQSDKLGIHGDKLSAGLLVGGV